MEEDLKVRHFKLINGEQIIAAVNSKNDDNWYLGLPVQVTAGMINGYQFSPWFPFSKEENYKIRFTNVLQSTPVDEEIKEAYVKFVLNAKSNLSKPKLESRSTMEILEELEMEVDDQMAEMFEDEGFIGKKKTIH
jgi:hypothetical protein